MSVLLFNPRSNFYKPRIPNSVLQIAASIDGIYEWRIVDGNLESDPHSLIDSIVAKGKIKYLGITVMPGPQLRQAIPITIALRKKYPQLKIIWGGYFATNQHDTVLRSGMVDFVVYGMGDKAFPALLSALENRGDVHHVPNLIFIENGTIHKTLRDPIYDLDTLQPLPYTKLNNFYSMQRYLGRTYLGNKTIAYHSSFGCPFTCGFCAVVPIYNARWKGKSAVLVYDDIMHLRNEYGGDAIEFHDNNFFVSEKRVLEFASLMKNENMIWWGEGRIDTIDKYSDTSLALMREAGCKMIFFGAETGNDEVLRMMDKGGTQSGAQIKKFAQRMKAFDIIPEYSFVLGMPAPTELQVWKQIREDIAFIKEIKEINPDTEIIIYVYSPVPMEGSEVYEQVKQTGFRFPTTLEEWITPAWENFDLRKNPLTPWLTPAMVDYIRNFETVLNGCFPTVSDYKLQKWQRHTLNMASVIRYRKGIYKMPYEIKAMQKLFKYRQPEKEGF